jgi:hypothetical protein
MCCSACTIGKFQVHLYLPDRLVLLSELPEALRRMAGQPLNDVASGLLKVVGSQQLETRHEPSKVVGDARLNETVYAALLVELDVRNLAAENVRKCRGNLCMNR